GRELARFTRETDAKSGETGIRHQLAAPSIREAFEPALLADRVVGFLVTVAGLGDHVAIALRERVALRNNGSLVVDEDFAAQLGHRGDDLVSDRVAELADFARRIEG